MSIPFYIGEDEIELVEYQISHGIEMRYNFNSIVWMSLN
jgi:hypothetical protein